MLCGNIPDHVSILFIALQKGRQNALVNAIGSNGKGRNRLHVIDAGYFLPPERFFGSFFCFVRMDIDHVLIRFTQKCQERCSICGTAVYCDDGNRNRFPDSLSGSCKTGISKGHIEQGSKDERKCESPEHNRAGTYCL